MANFEEMYGPFFTHEEFQCKCGECNPGKAEWYQSPEFKAFVGGHLMPMRLALAFPFVINSGYRCPAYNASLYLKRDEHLDGPHTKGAADIQASFERAYQIIAMGTARGMGVGIHQRGPVADRYIHLDNQGPRVWTY